jgi:hypothetical protein
LNAKFENKVHNKGIIKFCDAGTLEITTNSGMDIVKYSPLTSICKFIDDFAWYSHTPIKTIKKP